MKIKGFFCGTTARTNEEYKKELERKNIWKMVLILAGCLITVTAFYAEKMQKTALSEEVLGVYAGFGTGIALAGVILLVRSVILIRNEEKLKQARLENADERLNEIRSKAANVTCLILLLVICAGGMIGSIFEPVLIKATIFLIDVFVLSYIAAFSYYKKKM